MAFFLSLFLLKRALGKVILSPFPFCIAMEYFSRVLQQKKGRDFKFHPKCKKVGIMELLFADDLLIFSKPDVCSMLNLKEMIDNFACVSGLKINSSKIAIYIASIQEEKKVRVLQAIGIPHGDLPFRYLGFPLSSRGSVFMNVSL